MKNVIRVIGIFAIMVVLMIASITIYTKDSKDKETRQALEQSMEQAVSNLTMDDLKTKSESDLADYFTGQLVSSVTSINKGMDVKIYGINYKEGFIDAEATAKFNYVLGSGSVTVRKTIYIDEKSDEQKVVSLKNTEMHSLNLQMLKTKSIVVSSSVDKEHAAKKMTDDKNNTYWESEFDPTDIDISEQNITIDLGLVYSINRLKIEWGDNYAKSYDIELSADKKKWEKVYETDLGDGEADNIKFDESGSRYVRINLHSKSVQDKGYQIKKVSIYPTYSNVKMKTENVKNKSVILSENCFVSTTDKNADTIANIVDNKADTYWNSEATTNVNVLMDLGAVYELNNVLIDWNTKVMNGDTTPYYSILYSEDNKNWETYSTVDKNGEAKVNKNVEARYIKFIGNNSNNKCFSINDIKVTGKGLNK